MVRLTAADAAAGNLFGESVALSGDTAIISARPDDDAGTSSGSAYVFVRGANNVWDDGSADQQTKLTSDEGTANDEFGSSLAVDGDTALGAHEDDGPTASNQGTAYVFFRFESGWLLRGKLKAGDAMPRRFRQLGCAGCQYRGGGSR